MSQNLETFEDRKSAGYAIARAYRQTSLRQRAVDMAMQEFPTNPQLYEMMWQAIDAYADEDAEDEAA